MPHKPGIGAIFGITSEEGVAAQKRVVLVDRSNLSIVAKTTADASGGYTFNGLNPDTNDYLVFAVDDDGSPLKEAIIHDCIQPIPAYQGATFIGNWEKRAMSGDPISGFFGLLDQNGSPIEISGHTPYFEGSGVTYGQTSLTPGATHIPATALDDCSLGFGARTSFGIFTKPTKISLEWVFRRSSVSTARHAGVGLFTYFSGFSDADNSYGFTFDHDHNSSIAALHYNPADAKLRAYNQNGGLYTGPWGGWREIANVDLSTYPDDVHVVLAMTYANTAVLYINGAPVATVSLGGQNAVPWRANGDCWPMGTAIFGNIDDSGTAKVLGRHTTVLSGPVVAYDRMLSAQEVLDRYNDLMVGTTPAETGYAKEILLDHPRYYYRLREPDGTSGRFADWLTQSAGNRRALTIYNSPDIDYAQSSPVVGGSAVKFNGAAAARGDFSIETSSSRRELSFAFIIEPTVALPTANELIVGNHNTAEVMMTAVFRNTAGELVLRTREGGIDTDYTFTTALAAGVRKFVVITLNKGAAKAKMYLDGTLVETLPATDALLDQQDSRAGAYHETMIGGRIDDARTSMSLPFRGYLSEVAFFNHELPASRVKAHYDARSVV